MLLKKAGKATLKIVVLYNDCTNCTNELNGLFHGISEKTDYSRVRKHCTFVFVAII